MTAGRFRSALLMAGLGGSVAVTCLLLPPVPLPGSDPALPFESVGVVALVAWLSLCVQALIRQRPLAGELETRSWNVRLHGLECRIVGRGGRHAFVLGALRPRIYIGDGLLSVLDDEELRGVLLHEDHHRRTWGPLRALALESWLSMLGRWPPLRDALEERLADLERAADADAIRRGVAPAALASALLKADPGPIAATAGFTSAADHRILALLSRADGAHESPPAGLPYEWLPAVAVAIIVFACHLTGLPPLG